jgi:hypothetical protein
MRRLSVTRLAIRRVYLATAILVGLLLYAKAVPDLRHAFQRMIPMDLSVDHRTARAYLDNYSPFTSEGEQRSGLAAIRIGIGYGHPPTTSFWALPLAPLEIRTAQAVLGGITFLLLLIEVVATLRLLASPAPLVTAWLAMGFLLSCPFMSYHVGVGQLSGVIGFLYFIAWWGGRKGNDLITGAALGAASTMKFFPGVMILFLVVTRRWRAVGVAACVYLGIAAVMTARFGLLSWTTFFAAQSRIADRWMGDIQNQSIYGIVSRMFEPVCVPHGPVLRSAMLLAGALSVILLGLAVWCTRRTAQTPGSFDAAFALFAALSVVTSQWTWEHYTIIYVVPVIVLGAELYREFGTGRHRIATAAMAILLVGIVASWQINIHLKQLLQKSVQGGNRADHFALHLFDVLNWAPGIALLISLFVVCRWLSLANTPWATRDDGPGAREGVGLGSFDRFVSSGRSRGHALLDLSPSDPALAHVARRVTVPKSVV